MSRGSREPVSAGDIEAVGRVVVAVLTALLDPAPQSIVGIHTVREASIGRPADSSDDGQPFTLTVKEAAARSGVSTWQMYQLLDSGQIAGRRLGRKRLVLYDSLKAYLEALPEDPA